MESSDSVSDLEECDGSADDSISSDNDINSGVGPSSLTAVGKRKHGSDSEVDERAKKRQDDPNSDSLDEDTVRVVPETTCAKRKCRNSDDNLDKKETYSAREGLKNSLHGVVYQLKLLMLFLHFAWVKGYRFRLATEMNAAEKFDDVVYQFEENPGSRKHRFLQLKHKQDGSKKISVRDLLADDDGDFSLLKYFRSWREIKKKTEFKETGRKQFIICTNVGLDKEKLKEEKIKVDDVDELDDFLNITPRESQCYKLISDSKSKLFEVLKSASDLHQLARELAARVNGRKALDKTGILRRYHVALMAEKIVDKETKMFHDNFINNKQLSPTAVEFRQIFYEHAKEFRDNKKASETGIWNRLKSYTFRISEPFGIKSSESELEELPDASISDREISDFLQEFILAVNQPNEEQLDKLIEEKFGECRRFKLLNTNFLKNSFQNDMLNWFKSKRGVYLVKEDAKTFFDDLERRLSSLIAVGLSSPYLRRFEKYNVKYKRSDKDLEGFLKGSDPPGNQILLQYTCSDQTWLTSSRIYQTVKSMERYTKDDSFIFMELEDVLLPKITSLVFCAFSSPENQNLLIIDCGLPSADQNMGALWNEMRRAMKELSEKKITGKRIIIIVPEKNARIIKLGLPHIDLYETEDDISIDKLTENTQRVLLAKKLIKFQGRDEKTSYACLLGAENFDNTEDHRRIINPQTLVRIIQGTEIKIGHEESKGLGQVASFYIPRTIDRRVVIKNDIFKYTEGLNDVFAIGGIDEEIFEKLWQDENRKEKNSSQQRLHRDSNKYVILQNGREKDDFDTRCQGQTNCNIHWLQRESEEFVWKQSHGSIINLLKYRKETERDNDTDRHGVIPLSEEELAECRDDQPKIIILSDTAGMGKSTVLTRLAEIIRDNEPSLLVIKINLTDHTKVFDSEQENRSFYSDDYNGAVDFLVDKLIPNLEPEAVLVFKTMIKVRRAAALLFDGFDEISPHYKEIVVDLIHAFSKLGVKKLFVTTRPHTGRALEEKLGVFSQSLQPFSKVNQVEFFTKFWESRIGSSHNKADMERHAKHLITLLTQAINRWMQEFTGVPLQTRMVAEVFPYAEGSELAEKLPKSITIIDLYRRFVDTKYEIYKKVKSNCDFTKPANKDNDKEYRQSFLKKHQKFSVDALFDDRTVELLTGKPIVIESCQSSLDGSEDEAMVRQGMILRFTEGKPQFIHRTFAEYFAATFLFRILTDDSRNQSVRKFFVAKLFVDSEFQVIRAFLNCLLRDGDHVGQKNSWTFILKQHCNSYCSRPNAYHVAARERHDGIAKFLLDHLTEDHGVEFLNICSHAPSTPWIKHYTSPLNIAMETPNNFKVVKCFVDAGAKITCERSGSRETPLHTAVRQNVNFDAIEYIRDDIECGIRDDFVIRAVELGQFDIVKLFEMKGARLHCNNFESLATAARTGHLEVVEYLLQKGGKINSHIGYSRDTPLCLAAQSGQFKVVKYLVENGANIDATSRYGETPLHGASSSGHLNVVGYLIERGASIHSLTPANETPLHFAARSYRLDIVKYL